MKNLVYSFSLILSLVGCHSIQKRSIQLSSDGSVVSSLVRIEKGEFLMGNSQKENTKHVKLDNFFWIGQTEVTQEQFSTIMGKNPSMRKGKHLPVERVSWQDAMTFCKKLTDTQTLGDEIPDNYIFRLPTEKEWEYACRAGTTTIYSFGNDRGELDKYAWHRFNSQLKTHQVSTKLPNKWGLYDMHGNVGEWCYDFWKDNSEVKAIRGGCFRFQVHKGSAGRSGYDWERGMAETGFRIVLAPRIITDEPSSLSQSKGKK